MNFTDILDSSGGRFNLSRTATFSLTDFSKQINFCSGVVPPGVVLNEEIVVS